MRAAAIATLLTLTACELASTTIPRTDPTLVVHSVLNPSTRIQYVLVEESLTGAVSVIDDGSSSYDPSNPIVTGNGVPVAGAVVELTDPDGVVMTGTETRQNGRSTGIYMILLDNYSTPGKTAVIQLGKRYELSVCAKDMTVTGSTLIPIGGPPISVPTVSFNRDRQSVSLAIKDVSLSRAFWVRVEAPLAPYSLFTLDQEVAIAGDTRNIFTAELIRLFYPGFLQTLTVAAVDTNVYDYYRSGNDPFSGTGLINHLSGGLGLFGSIVVVDQRLVDVTQDPTGDPIEGRFTRRGNLSPSPTRILEMTLFLAAKGSEGTPDQISGSHLRGTNVPPARGAVYGTRDGNNLDLGLLTFNSTAQSNGTFVGIAKGDTLIGTFGQGGQQAVFVRLGK